MRLTCSILLGLLTGTAFTLLGHNGLSVIVGIAIGIGVAFAAYENDI